MILIEKQQKYLPNHRENFINTNILPVKIYYHRISSTIIEQTKFTYSPSEKDFEKQIKTIEDQGKKQGLKTLESDNKLSIKDVVQRFHLLVMKLKKNLIKLKKQKKMLTEKNYSINQAKINTILKDLKE